MANGYEVRNHYLYANHVNERYFDYDLFMDLDKIMKVSIQRHVS